MNSERVFNYCLMFSLILHIGLILGFTVKRQMTKPIKAPIEVMYKTVKSENFVVQSKKSLKVKKQELKPVAKLDLDVLSKKDQSLPFDKGHMKDFSKMPRDFRLDQEINRVGAHMVKEKVTIPLLDSKELNNPKYQGYNNIIRQKIREHAYYYVEHPDFRSGQVYLTFALKSTGVLDEIRVIDTRTRANDYLKSIAMQSVKDASPFPPFPGDLKYPELTFNVVISFEVE